MPSDRQPEPQGKKPGLFARLKDVLRRLWQRLRAIPATEFTETSIPPESRTDQVIRSTARTRSFKGRVRLHPWLPPSRNFILLQPARPVSDLKLLVLIHGCKQAAEQFAKATGAYDLVATGKWAVLLPDQSRTANVYRCWNWFDRATMRGHGEVAIVLKALADAMQDPALAAAPCAIAGLSSGAALAAAIVANHPDRFTAAVFFAGLPMAATLSPLHARQVMESGPERDVTLDLPASGKIAALIVHGDRDETVNPVNADELTRQMLTINGRIVPGTPLPPPGKIINTEPSVDVAGSHYGTVRSCFGNCERLIVQGMAHAWSGGNEAWPYFDSKGPDGLALASRFVERQTPKHAAPITAITSEAATTTPTC